MEKTRKKNFITKLCFAVALVCTAGIFTAISTQKAYAESEPSDILLAPTTYEQYLHLSSPTDIAVNERYKAIADGNIIYLYDSENSLYRQYAHQEHEILSKNTVSQLQFDESGNLYFTDDFTSDNLYKLNPETLTAPTRIEEVACRTFAVFGDALYFTNAQKTLYYANINDIENAQDILTQVDAFCLQGEELYAVRSGFYLHKLHAPTQKIPDGEIASTSLCTLYGSVKSLQVKNNTVVYSTTQSDFYAHPINLSEITQEQIISDIGGYANINLYGQYAYAVKANSVKQFDIENRAFTDFEISSSSTQAHRLNGATDILQVDNKLYILDNGNHRILVYDTNQNAFCGAFDAPISALYMSADKQRLLTANEQSVALYSIEENTYGTLLARFDHFNSTIKGVSAVYGNYYIACEGFVYALTQENGEWINNGIEKPSFFPQAFTNDSYGDLYAVQNNSVYRFTERDLLTADNNGTRLCASPVDTVKKLVIDYERHIYLLSDNTVYKVAESVQSVDFSTPIVYAQQTNATSFSFGIEENETYLLFDGNYMVKSTRLGLPTVKRIAVEEVDKQIFAEESAQFEAVTTAENALFIEFDLQSLPNATLFPYVSYHRQVQPLTALKIGETSVYNLLAVFDKGTNRYHSFLVLKAFCQPLNTNDYRQTYEESLTGYLTNEITLYKFPYLTSLLTVERLQRGEKVTLLGEVNELDHSYYHIAYQTADGTQKTGYIPKSYITQFDGAPLPTTQTNAGASESDKDAVWRLTYLLLGFSVVCILTDFLLLKRKNNDE